MNLKTLLSVLLVYRSNFHVLHWMAKGSNFFTIHEKAAEYYDIILDDVDIIAEMILRRSSSIVNYKEALDIIEDNEDHEFLLLNSSDTHDADSFKTNSVKMFKDIIICIEELLEDDEIQNIKNTGIRSSLEAMYDKYDLQCNYLLNRFGD